MESYWPDLWYYARKFDTLEEAQILIDYMKTALYERPDNDELLTMTFSNPGGQYFALIAGFPTKQTKQLVTLLTDKPSIKMTPEEIDYAREEIAKLRREQGVSDEEMLQWTQKQGTPDFFIHEIMRDYLHATEEESGDIRIPVPGLERIPPTPEEFDHYKNRPFIIFYRDIMFRDMDRLKEHGPYPVLDGTEVYTEATKYTIGRKIKESDKYQFDLSAQAMLKSVRDPEQTAWLPLSNHLWIEFAQPICNECTANEPVKALWINNAWAGKYIYELMEKAKRPDVYEAMLDRHVLYYTMWSLDIITSDCYELFDFTYDTQISEFVYPASHKCPWKQCDYPIKEGPGTLGTCVPCEHCRAALDYWASVLNTAIRQIRREFALVPEEPAPLQSRVESYSEEVQVSVGKGKNKRTVKQQVKREVEYRVVSYEVSEISAESRQRARDLLEEEQSRGNWLTVTDPLSIAWEYKQINVSRGRFLDPERNPRWKQKKHIDIAPFKKWVPMLRERKTIKRVKARRYTKESQ